MCFYFCTWNIYQKTAVSSHNCYYLYIKSYNCERPPCDGAIASLGLDPEIRLFWVTHKSFMVLSRLSPAVRKVLILALCLVFQALFASFAPAFYLCLKLQTSKFSFNERSKAAVCIVTFHLPIGEMDLQDDSVRPSEGDEWNIFKLVDNKIKIQIKKKSESNALFIYMANLLFSSAENGPVAYILRCFAASRQISASSFPLVFLLAFLLHSRSGLLNW